MMMAGLDGIQNKIDPGDPLDKDIYALSPEELKDVPRMPASLDEALDALEEDHEFLLKGDVFTRDLIDMWLDYKREHEVQAMRLRPTPYEFFLYYDTERSFLDGCAAGCSAGRDRGAPQGRWRVGHVRTFGPAPTVPQRTALFAQTARSSAIIEWPAPSSGVKGQAGKGRCLQGLTKTSFSTNTRSRSPCPATCGASSSIRRKSRLS
jgi:hypothetical protein